MNHISIHAIDNATKQVVSSDTFYHEGKAVLEIPEGRFILTLTESRHK